MKSKILLNLFLQWLGGNQGAITLRLTDRHNTYPIGAISMKTTKKLLDWEKANPGKVHIRNPYLYTVKGNENIHEALKSLCEIFGQDAGKVMIELDNPNAGRILQTRKISLEKFLQLWDGGVEFFAQRSKSVEWLKDYINPEDLLIHQSCLERKKTRRSRLKATKED